MGRDSNIGPSKYEAGLLTTRLRHFFNSFKFLTVVSMDYVMTQDDSQIFFRYFRMSVSKFENLKQLLQTEIEWKNTRWGT